MSGFVLLADEKFRSAVIIALKALFNSIRAIRESPLQNFIVTITLCVNLLAAGVVSLYDKRRPASLQKIREICKSPYSLSKKSFKLRGLEDFLCKK